MDTLTLVKLGAAAVILGCGVFGGMAPWWAHMRPGSLPLGRGSAFAGGVLLGAGLIHLLGDAVDGFDRLRPDGYPWAYLITGAAFLGVLFVERVAARIAHVPADTQPSDEVDIVLESIGESSATPYLLLTTLSMHSLLAGTALGAQGSLAGFGVVFLAVIAHKGAAGFALGASLARVGFDPRRALKLVLAFAVMTPAGVLIGTGMAALLADRGELVFEAIFDAIAAGTFLYIATLDVIREEFLPPATDRGIKWVCAVAGLGVMALLAVWT